MRKFITQIMPRERDERRITQKVHHGGWGEGGQYLRNILG